MDQIKKILELAFELNNLALIEIDSDYCSELIIIELYSKKICDKCEKLIDGNI